jgi:hypothetical protein
MRPFDVQFTAKRLATKKLQIMKPFDVQFTAT